jgi:hypothetical protein
VILTAWGIVSGKLAAMFKGLEPKPGTIHVGILRAAILWQFLELVNQSHEGTHFFWHRAYVLLPTIQTGPLCD